MTVDVSRSRTTTAPGVGGGRRIALATGYQITLRLAAPSIYWIAALPNPVRK